MDLFEANQKLISILESWFLGNVTLEKLDEFTWGVMEHFISLPMDARPNRAAFEKIFWYAIWQIQALCLEEHSDEGFLDGEFLQLLKYLKGEITFPENLLGLGEPD